MPISSLQPSLAVKSGLLWKQGNLRMDSLNMAGGGSVRTRQTAHSSAGPTLDADDGWGWRCGGVADTWSFWRKHFYVIFAGEEPAIALYYQEKVCGAAGVGLGAAVFPTPRREGVWGLPARGAHASRTAPSHPHSQSAPPLYLQR